MADQERERGEHVLGPGRRRPATPEERQAAWDRINRQAEETRREREEIEKAAEGIGFVPNSRFPGVWFEKDEELKPGQLPARFFTDKAEFLDGRLVGLEMTEHVIEFPIRNTAGLVKVLGAIDTLYDRGENAVIYDRRGIGGLIEYVRDVAGELPTRKPRR